MAPKPPETPPTDRPGMDIYNNAAPSSPSQHIIPGALFEALHSLTTMTEAARDEDSVVNRAKRGQDGPPGLDSCSIATPMKLPNLDSSRGLAWTEFAVLSTQTI